MGYPIKFGKRRLWHSVKQATINPIISVSRIQKTSTLEIRRQFMGIIQQAEKITCFVKKTMDIRNKNSVFVPLGVKRCYMSESYPFQFSVRSKATAIARKKRRIICFEI